MTLYIDNVQNAYIVKEAALEKRATVLDIYSYAVSNIIIGNPENSPAIEIVDGYLEGVVREDCFVAITGPASIVINDSIRAKNWSCILLRKGSKIYISTLNKGVAYLAIYGGIRVNIQNGRIQVSHGDIIDNKEPYVPFEDLLIEMPARHLPERLIPKSSRHLDVSLLTNYKVPREYVLVRRNPSSGFKLKPYFATLRLNPRNLVSLDPPQGAVVMEKNSLRVLSSPTNDSMPVLGTLTSPSLDALSRVKVGDKIRFKQVSPINALKREISYLKRIRRIKKVIELAVNALRRGAVLIRIKYGNKVYEAWVEEIK